MKSLEKDCGIKQKSSISCNTYFATCCCTFVNKDNLGLNIFLFGFQCKKNTSLFLINKIKSNHQLLCHFANAKYTMAFFT